IAESVDDPGVMKVRELARELQVDFVLGFLERDGDVLYNSCAWINAQGDIVHVHRKTHMAQPYFEPDFYHPGYEINAFDTRFGRMGMMICYERQVPEVATVLALDGARYIFNPSYGGRGEWNTTMLCARARDNQAWLLFTHPKQTLVVSEEGEVLVDVDDEKGAGIVYTSLEKIDKPASKLLKRRPEVFAGQLSYPIEKGNQRSSNPGQLKVASVQLRSVHNMKENVNHICELLKYCANQGARVALFPECATSGYFTEDILNYSEKDFLDAEKDMAAVCAEYKIYAVVGTPYFEDGVRYNMALVINDQGETIYRQAKIQLVGGDTGWAAPGNRLGLFQIDDDTCSLIICHDSRYPELVRLPVIKGSRLVFYMSNESGIKQEHKIDPYRAQVVARAVENNVYIVQANAPQTLTPLEGSHGQSRIVAPDGTLLKEASILGEDVLMEVLDLGKSTGGLAKKSMRAKFLKEWWEDGLINPIGY
ncbi:MAG: carbon-nitrogen hydrolase family protein, partial [Bacteroidales bacterium]|nr:carbon-nitrogen hydrolase family protein [Bacteroidales bacterium]